MRWHKGLLILWQLVSRRVVACHANCELSGPPDAHLDAGEWAVKPAVVSGRMSNVGTAGQHVQIDLFRVPIDDPDFEDADLSLERELLFGLIVGTANLDNGP